MPEYNTLFKYKSIAEDVRKLKGGIAIGVNKCNAQFTHIYFGPNKIDRKFQIVKKVMSELDNLNDQGNNNTAKRELTDSLRLILEKNTKIFRALFLN